MKKLSVFIILAVLIMISTATLLLAENTGYIYNPSLIYRGPFKTNAIYFHNRRNPVWYLGIRQELDSIKCRAAQDSFSRTGRWSGHFEPDSSCGNTSEPTEWAVGNWLNFSGVKGK